MKTILLLLFPVLMSAQGIFVTNITPTNPCPGESFSVEYTIAPGNAVLNLVGRDGSQVWQYDYNYLTSQPYIIAGNDTIYTIQLLTKPFLGKAPAVFYANQQVFSMELSCELTGISELNAKNSPEKQYFDIYGNRISAKSNEIMIEKIGNSRRKVVILE